MWPDQVAGWAGTRGSRVPSRQGRRAAQTAGLDGEERPRLASVAPALWNREHRAESDAPSAVRLVSARARMIPSHPKASIRRRTSLPNIRSSGGPVNKLAVDPAASNRSTSVASATRLMNLNPSSERRTAHVYGSIAVPIPISLETPISPRGPSAAEDSQMACSSSKIRTRDDSCSSPARLMPSPRGAML